MARHSYDPFPVQEAERLIGLMPNSGRDLDLARFFLKRGKLGEDALADLLAAYRVEIEEKLEYSISLLQDEVDSLREELER